jgi:hypothetical protein
VIFAIVFSAVSPFFSIAWLYAGTEDGGPACSRWSGQTQVNGRQIIFARWPDSSQYAACVSGHVGWITCRGSGVSGTVLCRVRLARFEMAQTLPVQAARQLLQATVFYLPLLFALMMHQYASINRLIVDRVSARGESYVSSRAHTAARLVRIPCGLESPEYVALDPAASTSPPFPP